MTSAQRIADRHMKVAGVLRAPHGKLLIELSATPNPDYAAYSSDPRGSINLDPTFEVVQDFKEASQVARRFIRRNNLSGGNWTGGHVYDEQGVVVAHVSYNGRVWEGGDKRGPATEIHI